MYAKLRLQTSGHAVSMATRLTFWGLGNIMF